MCRAGLIGASMIRASLTSKSIIFDAARSVTVEDIGKEYRIIITPAWRSLQERDWDHTRCPIPSAKAEWEWSTVRAMASSVATWR